MENLSPNLGQNPQNNSFSRKKVLLGILGVILVVGITYSLSSGTSTQGLIRLKTTEPQPISRGLVPRDTTTTTTTTPTTSLTNTGTSTPVETPKLDVSTMNLSRQWQGESKYANTIFYNDPTNGVQFDLTLPSYKGPDYSTTAHLQLCKNSNCTDLKTLDIQTLSIANRTIVAQNSEVNSAINKLGINNNDQAIIQYSINDSTGKTYTSKSLVYTFFDYNAKPAVASGQTLFDKNTMSASSGNNSQILYDKNVKTAISLQFNLPTYSLDSAPNAKTSYVQPVSLKVCSADANQCQKLKDDTVTIFYKDQKFQNNPDSYRKYVYIMSNDDLVNLIKNSIVQYNGKFFFTFSIQDPTGSTLTTNSVELVISDQDKAAIMTPPIVGNIFDAATFTMNVNYSKPMPAGQITYDANGKQPITFKYQLPNIKVSAPETQYMTTTILEFCNDSLSSCTDVSSFDSYVFSTDNPMKQTVITDADFDTLIAGNPDKTTFIYKIKDPSGSTFFTSNSFKLIKQ